MWTSATVEMASFEGLSSGGSEIEGSGEEAPAWVIEVKEAVKKTHPPNSTSPWSIYRVPERLHHVQESAFIPKLVSVGPFHMKDRKLEAMNERKMQALAWLLQRDLKRRNCSLSDTNSTTKLNILIEEMGKLEKDARACYSEHFHIPGDEFVRMMVFDGCFIVELLRQHHLSVKQKQRWEDSIFVSRWMLRTIQRDLLLLENQLPFLVLEKLFELTNEERLNVPIQSSEGSSESINSAVCSFEELAIRFFEPLLLPKRSLSSPKLGEMGKRKCKHLLDLFRSTFIIQIKEKGPISWETELGNTNQQVSSDHQVIQEKYKQLMYPAAELEEAGVSLRKKKVTPDFDFLSIEFEEDGTLIIPPLYLDDYTVPMFLNFLAFEQCTGIEEPFFSNYFMFWDGLIDTEADVEILHRKRVINHSLGSGQDVVILLNKVGREIAYDQNHCYLYRQMKGLNQYCDKYYSSKLSNWWRKLQRDYFSSPWTFLSLVAAVILLVLTFLQTFFTIYGFRSLH